jgi:EmrB/QacA subfamily drug resistance transporter
VGGNAGPTAAIQVLPDRQRQRLILAVLVCAQLLVWLDNSVLNLALKTLADPAGGLGATPGELQWSISLYTLVFASLLFTGGVLGDRYGHRRVLTVGLVIFGLGSLWAAYSGGPTELIIARGVMGVGGATLMPATLSIITHVFEPERRMRAIAVWAASSGVGIATGPVVSGVLLDNFWWGSVFLINLPIVALALIGIGAFVPADGRPQQRRLDVRGVILSMVGLTSLVYGVIRGGQDPWTSPSVWGPIVFGLAVLGMFAFVETRVAEPSFELRLFRNPQFAGGSLAMLFLFFGLAGQIFYSTFYLQGARGLSPSVVGLLVVPPAIGLIVGTQVAPRLAGRFPTHMIVVGGMLLAIATFGGHALFDLDTPLVWYELMLFAQGFGMGLVTALVTATVMAALPRERTGAGSAVNTSMRQIGTALGVAVVGSILAASFRKDIQPSLAGLSNDDREAATVSAEATRAVAQTLGRTDLVQAANEAYLSAMYLAAFWSTVVSLVGVAMILGLFRRPS